MVQMNKMSDKEKSVTKKDAREAAIKSLQNMGPDDSAFVVVLKEVKVGDDEGHHADAHGINMNPMSRASVFLTAAQNFRFGEREMELLGELAENQIDRLAGPAAFMDALKDVLKGKVKLDPETREKMRKEAGMDKDDCDCPACKVRRAIFGEAKE